MVADYIHKICHQCWNIPRLYWVQYEEDPREDQYYRTMQMLQYGEVWNTWKIPSS